MSQCCPISPDMKAEFEKNRLVKILQTGYDATVRIQPITEVLIEDLENEHDNSVNI